MPKPSLLLATLLAAVPAAAQTSPTPAFDVAAARARIDATLDRAYPRLDALYRDLHQHPELGFQEVRTAAKLAAEMRRLGFTVTEKVGRTGIVAILKNGDGPTVLVRTEMDALPMEEKTGLPYASREKQMLNGETTFVDHSCGHDSHMAWWVGAAQALVAMKDRWHGTLMFIGQPSEENVEGAKAMIADGLFTRWKKPDFGFAAHVSPGRAGAVTVKDGAVSSASDTVEIAFKGVGAHGSMPDKGIDPIMIGGRFVTDVQTVISREKDPNLFGVISVGSFVAGTTHNIIPDQALLKLTLRSRDDVTRKLLLDGVTRIARASAEMAHAPDPAIAHPYSTNAVRNDSVLAARTAATLSAAFAKDVTFVPAHLAGGNGSEDFAAFIDEGVPSVFFGIGGLDPAMIAQYEGEGKPLPVNHSPFFAPVPEPTIRRGAQTLALAVLTVAGTQVAGK